MTRLRSDLAGVRGIRLNRRHQRIPQNHRAIIAMLMNLRNLLPSLLVIVGTTIHAAAAGWTLKPHADGATLSSPAGRDLLGYLTQKPVGSTLSANSTSCLYPLLTPSGENLVMLGPKDHPHHRGVFLAWYHVAGSDKGDFWGWGAHAPTAGRQIVNTQLRLKSTTKTEARFEAQNEWRAGNKVLIRERTTFTTRVLPEGNWIEARVELTPVEDLTLPRAAFSGFCVKSHISPGSVFTEPSGPSRHPMPKYDDPTTGWPDSPWYDYTTTLPSGKTAGVTVFNHRSNPPTRWHNLQSIGMINPCILMGGDVKLKAGKTLTLRYALLAHDGPAPTNTANQLARRFGASSTR